MKRKTKKLRLSRETLAVLDQEKLGQARGGAETDFCSGETCSEGVGCYSLGAMRSCRSDCPHEW